jgi:ankyrin
MCEEMGLSTDDKWFQKLLAREIAHLPPPATRETIRILVDHGLDIEARDNTGRTPLIHACLVGNLAAGQLLLELGADLEARDDSGFTPLLCAVEKGHLALIKELDRRGADFAAITAGNLGVLHLAARDREVLRYLLGKNPDLELRSNSGMTPLIARAGAGHHGMVGMLLEAGAQVNATTGAMGQKGTTALHAACRNYDPDDVNRLQNRREALGGEKLDAQPCASREDRIRTIELLLDHGANPLAREGDWMTPLHLAARWGLPEAVERFLRDGAPPNIVTVQLNTPLHLAAKGGHLECARVLVENGAILDNPAWLTPLLVAAIGGGNADLVSFLIEANAPLDRRDAGTSAYPIHQAANEGTVRMLEAILDAGVNVNSRDNVGGTPLHRAAMHGRRDAIALLSERGARFDVTDSFLMSPADYAGQHGHHALAKTLADHADQARIERTARKLNQRSRTND